jgi:hypothetical protein
LIDNPPGFHNVHFHQHVALRGIDCLKHVREKFFTFDQQAKVLTIAPGESVIGLAVTRFHLHSVNLIASSKSPTNQRQLFLHKTPWQSIWRVAA